ncbi:MAG TPA: 30S ribosomal protein S17 [Fibrobacteres bacterium]|jgi:small subunit ribosomal protein S17|nr:30S ribosomal protein S17 [Fibrobacterota bacterium]
MSETIVARDNRRKTRVGVVVSDKMDKTITVAVINRKSHPLYGKTVHNTVKFKAHDDKNEAHEGDTVEIAETRPISKSKRWRLLRIVEKKK